MSARLRQLQAAAVGYATLLDWRIYQQHGVYASGDCTCHLGFRCPPRRRGKHPEVGWKQRATNDPMLVRSYWAAIPFNIATILYGLAVVDIDDRAVTAFLDQFGPWPSTWTQRSGRGLHLFFRMPTDGGIWPRLSDIDGHALETKGDGDSLTLAPSRHATGALYQWLPGRHPLTSPLADLPPRFLAHVRRIATRRSRRRAPLVRGPVPVETLIADAVARASSASNATGKATAWLRYRLAESGHADDVASDALRALHQQVNGRAA